MAKQTLQWTDQYVEELMGNLLRVGVSLETRLLPKYPVAPRPMQTGREVVHNLAKVGVVGSNPIARSKHLNDLAAFGLTDTEA